jgi:hypothetical protein
MLQLSVGQYLFDTAGTALHIALRAPSENLPMHQSGRVCSSRAIGTGWAYYKSGLLTYLITNSDLPAWLPFKLNTATFSFLLPNLYKLYPSTTPFTPRHSAAPWIR